MCLGSLWSLHLLFNYIIPHSDDWNAEETSSEDPYVHKEVGIHLHTLFHFYPWMTTIYPPPPSSSLDMWISSLSKWYSGNIYINPEFRFCYHNTISISISTNIFHNLTVPTFVCYLRNNPSKDLQVQMLHEFSLRCQLSESLRRESGYSSNNVAEDLIHQQLSFSFTKSKYFLIVTLV